MSNLFLDIHDLPVMISARCPNREHFKIPLPEVWAIMEDYLFLCQKMFELRLYAFVLMPNHFHLLMAATLNNLSPFLNYFLRETSRVMNFQADRINQSWGRRNHKSYIEDLHDFKNVYKYLYRNPVRAKLCERVEDYRYSTLSGLCGNTRLYIPLEEDILLFDPNFNDGTLQWLNTPSNRELEKEMQRALKKPVLNFGKNQQTGHASALITELL